MDRVEQFLTFDRVALLNRLFCPRPEEGPPPAEAEALTIPVAEEVALGGYWFDAGPEAPTILFFHGNGEIAADYAELGPLITARGIGFAVIDYRGYGRSGGRPTVSAMMTDCHAALDHLREQLQRRHGRVAPIVVMGRSLGSAPAVELASERGAPEVAGLVVESGFARAKPLLRTLGVGEGDLKQLADESMDNVVKIGAYSGPILVIHGAQDQLVSVGDGQALYQASPPASRDMLVVPRAGHNTLFQYALEGYLDAVERLVCLAAAGEAGA